MACDINDLQNQASCLFCEVPKGLVGYVLLAQLLRITGESAADIIEQATCLQCEIPNGLMGAAVLAATCNLGPQPEPPVTGDFRITEASDIRATEDDGLRIVE